MLGWETISTVGGGTKKERGREGGKGRKREREREREREVERSDGYRYTNIVRLITYS